MRKRITIIGGGASGTLLAVNLLKNANDERLEINLVEKRPVIGRGVAYSTVEDMHLLNVPAAKMGAFPDDVENFLFWLQKNRCSYEPNSFVPRKLFGEYLRDLLREAVETKPEGVKINVFDDEAVDVAIDNVRAQVILESGDILYSDKVVLAFGNSLPPHPSVGDKSFVTSKKYFQNPWDAKVYETIRPEDSILIIGTGLSMIDLAMHYHAAGHKGKISAISTRGLLPAVHSLGHNFPSFYDELKSQTRITDLLKIVRRHIAKAESEGNDWRGVIDSLRPHTRQIWLDLPVAEKRYFMQHLSRYWNVARHRMPPEAAAVLNEMQAENTLSILKGRLKKIEVNADGKFEIAYRVNGIENNILADAIVNCIGSECNFEKLNTPLVKNLVNSGHIKNDELSLGIAASPNGRIIGSNGMESSVFFTLGTALKGTLWETTAIPEIRTQAKALALQLLNKE